MSSRVCIPPLHPKPSLDAGEHQGKPWFFIPAMSLLTIYLPWGTPGLFCPSIPHSSHAHPSIHPSTCPSIYLCIHPSNHLFTYQPAYPSICPSFHPPLHGTVHLSVHQSSSEPYAAICYFLLPSSEKISQRNIVSPWTCSSCFQELNPRCRGQKVKAVIWGKMQ